jgi:transcriptional antiterminator RfaH
MDLTEKSAAPRWHLVMSKPSCEVMAASQLERQGYVVYYPRILQKSQRRGKWIDRIAPLFPRYLFVKIDSEHQALAPVRSTVGVANVVRFGVDYLVVSNEIVINIKSKEHAATGLHQLHVGNWFKPGDQVRIAAGSLNGLDVIFESDDGNHRVTVLLNLLGRETRIQVDAGYVASSAA